MKQYKRYDLQQDQHNLKLHKTYKSINLLLFAVLGSVATVTGLAQMGMPLETVHGMDSVNIDTATRGIFFICTLLSLYFLYKLILERQKIKHIKLTLADHKKYNLLIEKQKMYDQIDFEKLHALSQHLLKALACMIHDTDVSLRQMQQVVDQLNANNTNYLANYYLKNVKQGLPADDKSETLTQVDENGIPIERKAA